MMMVRVIDIVNRKRAKLFAQRHEQERYARCDVGHIISNHMWEGWTEQNTHDDEEVPIYE